MKRIGEIPGLRERPSPFRVVAGASAGAINGAMMAALAGDDLRQATTALAAVWSRLTVGDVFRSDLLSFLANGVRLVTDLGLGGLVGGGGWASSTPRRCEPSWAASFRSTVSATRSARITSTRSP